jgi:hypothetical protein
VSEYLKKRTVYSNRATLRAALTATGLPFEEIPEGHSERHLVGYMGKQRPETATFIIRRQNISPGANDLGWHWNPHTETFEEIISLFDSNHSGAQIATRVNQEYAGEHALAQAYAFGYELVDKVYEPTGEIKLVIGGQVG